MDITVLGTAQDAGIPRPGCDCPGCSSGLTRYGPALAVCGDERVLVDAPPEIRRMTALDSYDRLFLTHAHVGHYVGLCYLGREAYDTDGVALHCSNATADWFADGNKAYHHLVDRGNVSLSPFEPGDSFDAAGLTWTPVPVSHRNEDADTVGFRVTDGDTSLCYVPDCDHWTPRVEQAVRASDVALLDGTFYTTDELDGRDQSDVPHPPIERTMTVFEDCETDIYFIHLNHTNPVADPDSRAHERVRAQGFHVPADGDTVLE